MYASRACGSWGSIGTYAAPAFITPRIAAIWSNERSSAIPTTASGPSAWARIADAIADARASSS
ncbi:hypothetical protein BH11MYX1_BH11MYX1_20630 [soil metagenome]